MSDSLSPSTKAVGASSEECACMIPPPRVCPVHRVDRDQGDAVLTERTPAEKAAYIAGMRTGAKMMDDSIQRRGTVYWRYISDAREQTKALIDGIEGTLGL